MSLWVDAMMAANGLYDVACALSILCGQGSHRGVLSQLHLGMYRDTEHQQIHVFRRMVAYWILTYGCVRLVAAASGSYLAGGATYFLEALCLMYEHLAGGTLHPVSVISVCGMCVCMGWLSIWPAILKTQENPPQTLSI